MKKMIVIAALIGGMLMPAQMMASNDRGKERPRTEYRKDKKDKPSKRDYGRNDRKRYDKPAKPAPVVVVNRPAPRPCPPPPPPRRSCDSDVADVVSAVGTVLGIAAVISVLAR